MHIVYTLKPNGTGTDEWSKHIQNAYVLRYAKIKRSHSIRLVGENVHSNTQSVSFHLDLLMSVLYLFPQPNIMYCSAHKMLSKIAPYLEISHQKQTVAFSAFMRRLEFVPITKTIYYIHVHIQRETERDIHTHKKMIIASPIQSSFEQHFF